MQFLPHDPKKILVTSADSQVRIIDGLNVIEKYKGMYNLFIDSDVICLTLFHILEVTFLLLYGINW